MHPAGYVSVIMRIAVEDEHLILKNSKEVWTEFGRLAVWIVKIVPQILKAFSISALIAVVFQF